MILADFVHWLVMHPEAFVVWWLAIMAGITYALLRP